MLDSRKSDYNHITRKRVRWSVTRVSRSWKCVRRFCKKVRKSRKHVTRYKVDELITMF